MKELRIVLEFLNLITERLVALFIENGSKFNRINGK